MNTTLDLESMHPTLVELVEPCRARMAAEQEHLTNIYAEQDFAMGCVEMAYQAGLINCSEHSAYRALVASSAQFARDRLVGSNTANQANH